MKAYEEFVAAGVELGEREDLRGGGLIRSAGGIFALLARGVQAQEAADERILGGGEFVESVLHTAEMTMPHAIKDVQVILSEVAEETGIARELILGPSTARLITKARVAFYQRARLESGITAEELGRLTGRTHVAVIRALERARERTDKGM